MGPKKVNQEEDLYSLPMIYELLDQQKSFFKDLIEQQERNFKTFVQLFMDSTNQRMDNIMKHVQDIKMSLQFSQKDVDDLNKRLSDHGTSLKSISNEFASVQASFDKLSGKTEYLESQWKKNNIIIDGVPEERSESSKVTEAKVKQLLVNKPNQLKLNMHIARENLKSKQIGQGQFLLGCSVSKIKRRF